MRQEVSLSPIENPDHFFLAVPIEEHHALDSVVVECANGMLIVTGERGADCRPAFERQYPLPAKAEPTRMEVAVRDGMLHITAPRRVEDRRPHPAPASVYYRVQWK